jgi:putative ABC transport system permease protein
VSAVLRAARGGLAGRRLQAVIIAVVVLAGTATSVVAVGLLANSGGPFDRALAAQHGADVTAIANPAVATPARLARTARLAGVTAAAGPFPEVFVTARVAAPGAPGSSRVPLRVVGRASPGGPVDDLTLDDGHWPARGGQVVLARGDGIFTGAVLTIGNAKLTVTGVADSVTGTADAWALPAQVAALAARAGHGQAQMLYRLARAGSPAAVAAGIASVRAALPRGGLLTAAGYLSVRQSEQGSIAPFVPFIIAFGVIALVVSVLIVVNVVSGAVTAGTTRIGVLKAIGFTPAQVVACYVLLAAAPALAGCAAGAVAGNLLAIPMLTVNASVYQVGTLTVPLWADAAVPLGALALTVAGAIAPAARAGRMSAVAAIAAGRAPRPGHGYLAHRALARLPSLPRALTLGLAEPFARPARTLVTAAAIVFGAAAVTFGIGLATSLSRVVADGPAAALPVQVSLSRPGPGPGGPGPMTAAQQRAVSAALAAQPGTRHYLPVSTGQARLAGAAGRVSVTAYGGPPALAGAPLIAGRWYSAAPHAAEADVNTLFLTDTGTAVGSEYPLIAGGHRVTVRIVGEVFDPGARNVDLYLSPATLAALDPAAGPAQYDVALRPGTSPEGYARAVSATLGPSYSAAAGGGGSSHFLAVLALVAMLTILIMVVAGLGVLNTVALQIRERAHDIGVLKAIGMTPRQTLALLVCSVAAAGLAAGAVAVPAGVYLHHGVVPVMAHAANSGYPPSLILVYAPWELVLLALAGPVIAVAGALGPAGWAARARTAFALRAE